MQFAILGERYPRQPENYQGTYRRFPTYQEDLAESHPVNQAYLWYVQETGEEGLVRDLEKARQLVKTYQQLTPPQHFDIVEFTYGGAPPQVGEEFLGYDLSINWFSLLELGLVSPALAPEHLQDETIRQIAPLLKLVEVHFRPLLNKNGLFDTYETARFCLDGKMALQAVRPGLYENEEVVFHVIGLWKVPLA